MPKTIKQVQREHAELISDLVTDGPVPAKRLADLIGKNVWTLYAEANPDADHAKLGALTELEIELVTGDLRLVHHRAQALGGAFVRLPEGRTVEASDALERVLAVNREFGDVARALSATLADGRVTASELDRVRAEIYELHVALAELRLALAAMEGKR